MPVISIDCWGTIIKSSPSFVDAKVSITQHYFPTKSREEILGAFKELKEVFNNVIENTGYQPARHIFFEYLFYLLNGEYEEFYLLGAYMTDYDYISRQYKPQIYSEETIEYIRLLSKTNILALSSNTMFMSGQSLRNTLESYDILHHFNKINFSDELGVAKPHKKMYSASHYHIGDNEKTDGIGAKKAHSQPIIINSNDKTIKDAYNFITSGR